MPDLKVQIGGLDGVDPCHYPDVLAALGQHLGLDPVELRKAAGSGHGQDEGPDPRFPKLFRLLEFAKRDWIGWGDRLVSAVLELVGAGKLSPLTPANEGVLRALFADHEAAIVFSFTGRGEPGVLRRLVAAGLVRADVVDTAWIPTAFRLGRALSVMRPPPEQPPSRATLDELIRESQGVELQPSERLAVEAAARRGEIYMRRPAQQVTGDVWRTLAENERLWSPAELALLRDTTARAVEARKGARELARDLRDVVNGNPSMTNDMDRVARTELVNAHGAGVAASLASSAAAAGLDDPLVCKLVSPRACVDCKRIWGLPSAPIPYRLSFVRDREAAGGNFRLPHGQWGPVVGAVHPNCTEAGLLLYDPRFIAGANANAARARP